MSEPEPTNEDRTLEFINHFRTRRGLPTLAMIPERDEDVQASHGNPLSQALGFPIYRTFQTNVFTDLGDIDVVNALAQLNCPNTPYRIPSSAPMRYDVRLPHYTWEYAR